MPSVPGAHSLESCTAPATARLSANESVDRKVRGEHGWVQFNTELRVFPALGRFVLYPSRTKMKRIIFFCFLPIAAIISLVLANAAPAQAGNSGCYAHRPKYIEGVFEVRYDAGCTGHDEPEIDPVSSAKGSAT